MKLLSKKKFIAELETGSLIPPLPEIMLKIRKLLRDDRCSIKEVAELIEKDPSLVAHLLRSANSAFYGFMRKVDTVETALIVLGVKGTCQVLEGTILLSSISKIVHRVVMKRLIYHSTLVGFANTEIAHALGVRFHGAEYITGLLHDLGHAAICIVAPEYGRIIKAYGAAMAIEIEEEMDIVGITHCYAGKKLAELWQLPDEIAEAMGSHHDNIGGDKEISLASLTRFSVLLANHILQAGEGEDLTESIPVPEDHFAAPLHVPALIDRLAARMNVATATVKYFLE